jgi:hypothetical protein
MQVVIQAVECGRREAIHLVNVVLVDDFAQVQRCSALTDQGFTIDW